MSAPVIWPYRLAMAVIFAGMVTLFTTLGYILWPASPIYISEPIPVQNRNSEVRAGEPLFLMLAYQKPFENETLIGVMLASRGTVWVLPVGLASLPLGDHIIRFPVTIPSWMPPGDYVAILTIVHPVRLPIPTLFHTPIRANSVPFKVVSQ